MIPCIKAVWSTSVEVYCLLRSSLLTRALNSFSPWTKYLQGSSTRHPEPKFPLVLLAFHLLYCGDRWNCSIFEQGKNLWQRFPDEPEPELRYRFYCISVLIKFIAVVFEPSIFRVINLLRIPSQNLNITSCTFKNVDTNFPSIISPANFKTQIPLL